MALSTPVRSLVWTRRTAAVTILAAMAEQRARSAQRLAALMEARGLTQEKLAYEAGVSVKTINRWLNQRHDPAPTTLARVAHSLDVDEGDLWERPPPLGLNGAAEDPLQVLARIELRLAALEGKLDDLLAHADVERAADEADDIIDEARAGSGGAGSPRSGGRGG